LASPGVPLCLEFLPTQIGLAGALDRRPSLATRNECRNLFRMPENQRPKGLRLLFVRQTMSDAAFHIH
jgi:hypothetical protein